MKIKDVEERTGLSRSVLKNILNVRFNQKGKTHCRLQLIYPSSESECF